ncbi:MAG: hypothetical protein ACLQMT_03025 [Candidatus Acidiferrales bacterium]
MATSGERLLKNSDLRPSILKERHALLQRVLWSHQIEKSGRIRDFLVYVCERALREPAAEIHEQEIGARVFGRDGDYDTTADNIVRVTASQARKRLEQYFASEGASEPVILDIPKGKYTPVFHERGQAEAETATTPESQTHLLPGKRGPLVVILATSTALLAILTVWLAISLRRERIAALSELDTNPALNALWSQLIPKVGRTDVVVPDSSLSLFQELLDHQLTLSEYLKFDEWEAGSGLSSNPALQTFAQRAAQRNFTSMASATTAYRIAQLAGGDQTRISILSARNLSIRQMKYDNVILLGSTRANPWEELIEDRLNFRFGFDQKSRYSYFENRDPHPGELKMYVTDSGVSYCRIAFLPNLSGTGNILSISGTETEGTEGGGEFVTSERSIAQLISLAGPDHGGRMPYFEALLKSNRVGGATEGLTVVAFRLLHP